MVGAALAKTGSVAHLHRQGIGLIVLFIGLAPLIGLVVATVIALSVSWLFRSATPRRVDTLFRRGQFFSAAFFSLGHGGNDAQKTMGIIYVLLIVASADGVNFPKPELVPTEVVLAYHLAMALGTTVGG